MFAKKFLVFLALLVGAQSSLAAVWQTRREWDSNVEKDFAAWVKTHWTESVFMSPDSPYRGIETDCAQATYAMRIIFLYENGLTFKVRNHNGGPNTFLSNEMTNWDNISDPNLRLRAFLNFMFSNISTRTLGLDTYPVAVTSEGINSGTIYVDPGNHSVQVIDLTPQGVPIIQFSTTPRSVRFLTRLIAFPEMIPGQAKTNRDDGFRRFKSPDQLSMNLQRIPGFSEEQFGLAAQAEGDWTEYTKIFAKKLAKFAVSPNAQARQMIDNICQAGADRVKAVRDAMIVLALNSDKNVRCMDSGDYYNTSTPDRDKVLREYFVQLKKLTQDSDWSLADSHDAYHIHADYIVGNSNRDFAADEKCDLSDKGIGAPPGHFYLRDLYQVSMGNKLVSDPNATLEQRWGLSAFSPVCKQY